MNTNQPSGPQKSFLFRVVAVFSRLQLGYLFRSTGNPRLLVIIFVFIAGATALGIIAVTAYLTDLPLLFPPLGPSAFILFYTPMAVSASPRNVILSHTLAVVAGILSLWIVTLIHPEANLLDPTNINLYRVLAIALSMGMISIGMITMDCVHAPAAASAMIASMGYLTSVVKSFGLLAAIVLLVVEALIFNRLLGGLPYPFWRADPDLIKSYGVLAGLPDAEGDFWQELTAKIFQKR